MPSYNLCNLLEKFLQFSFQFFLFTYLLISICTTDILSHWSFNKKKVCIIKLKSNKTKFLFYKTNIYTKQI